MSGPVAEAADGDTAAPQDLAVRVEECKAVLEAQGSSAEEQLSALAKLKDCGDLPTKVLGDTLIGKSVNNVAKNAADERVRTQAKELVDFWRQTHRKRKSSGDGQPALKRGLSSTLSLGSEVSKEPVASQDSQIPSQLGQEQSLSRCDSLLSLGEESVDAAGQNGEIAAYRKKVTEKLLEVLGQAEEIESKDGNIGSGAENMRDPVTLAAEIDEALHKKFPKKEEYMLQARSVIYNLKDRKNHTFRFKLMVGFYGADDVPKLTAEEMASDEKNAERSKQRKYSMEAADSGWAIKNGATRICGMFTCGKCKGMKTTYFQMQTRSSDEPMTTFVTCLQCNNRWKFC